MRRSAEMLVVPPTAPAHHPAGPFFRTERVGNATLRIFAIPIAAPLPDVPGHIVKPKIIGRERTARGGVNVAILAYRGGRPRRLYEGDQAQPARI